MKYGIYITLHNLYISGMTAFEKGYIVLTPLDRGYILYDRRFDPVEYSINYIYHPEDVEKSYIRRYSTPPHLHTDSLTQNHCAVRHLYY